jgi:hypothetical protein
MKKALLVGINRYPSSPLKGCVNDVEDWHRLLSSIGHYPADSIRAVCDERATTQGIRDRMAWLKEGLKGPGDEVFFAFSGHGSQVRDRGVLDELADNMDEILCPVDLDWNTKVITDDDIGDWLKTFPKGAKITVVLDCCHSGTGTREIRPPQENPHYKADRYLPPPLDIALRAEGLTTRKGVEISVKIGRGHGKRNGWREAKANGKKKSLFWWKNPCSKPKPAPISTPVATMNHVLIAGCRSDQTSADALINSRYNGAFTCYLATAMRLMQGKPIREVHALARKSILNAGYTQDSQLEGPESLLTQPMFLP